MSLTLWRLSGSLIIGLSACVGAVGCGDSRSACAPAPKTEPAAETPAHGEEVAATPDRPMIISNAHQLGDLYWNGQIDDSKGYRWDVAIIPGISNIAQGSGKSFSRSGGYIKRFGTTSDGKDDFVGAALHFATRDCIGTFMVDGIHHDYASTSHDIHRLIREKPFTWYAILTYDAALGYVIKPLGRTIIGTVGATAGFACTAVFGSGEAVVTTAMVSGDTAIFGTTYPILLFTWQQPAYVMSIFTGEPDLQENGHWGLNIVAHHDPKTHESLPIPAPVRFE
jgi:hypothetical protein